MNYLIAFCLATTAGVIFGAVLNNKNSRINNSFSHSWTEGLNILLLQITHILTVLTIITLSLLAFYIVIPHDFNNLNLDLKEVSKQAIYCIPIMFIGLSLGNLTGEFYNLPNKLSLIKQWVHN